MRAPDGTDIYRVGAETAGRFADGQSGAEIFSETVSNQSNAQGTPGLKIAELFTLPQKLQATVEEAEKISRREFGILITLGGLFALTQKFFGDTLKTIGDVLSLPSGYSLAKPGDEIEFTARPNDEIGKVGIAGGNFPSWYSIPDEDGNTKGYIARVRRQVKIKVGGPVEEYVQDLFFLKPVPYKERIITPQEVYDELNLGKHINYLAVRGRKTGSKAYTQESYGAYVDEIDVLEILEAK